MILKLYDIREYSKPITKEMVQKEFDSVSIQTLMNKDIWFIDTMRDLFFINVTKGVASIRKIWFENDHDIYAEVTWLNTLVAKKVRAELKACRIKFHLKGVFREQSLKLIGFGYVYKPHTQYMPKLVT